MEVVGCVDYFWVVGDYHNGPCCHVVRRFHLVVRDWRLIVRRITYNELRKGFWDEEENLNLTLGSGAEHSPPKPKLE